MTRLSVLKVVLVLVGLLFVIFAYPMAMIVWNRGRSSYGEAMMLSLYVTLGIFLLFASRNPSAHRSLIAFAGWSSLAHATLMTGMLVRDHLERELMIGVAMFALIGAALLALAPAAQSADLR
jgi:Family of unknown function (DUF6632)